MKFFALLILFLFAGSSFSADGLISVETAQNRKNTLDMTVTGAAAIKISKHLDNNGVSFRRDPFSGAMVQNSEGIKCIEDRHAVGDGFYCYIAITEGRVVQ